MKKQWMKCWLTVICMLAAGICYSCGRGTNQVDVGSQASIMDLQEQISGEAGVQDGLISVRTEAEEESSGEPEAQSGEEPFSWQTESVRFYVHICGEVNQPGVYEMEPGSRIFQAVEAAGGFTFQAASDYLNMAQETADGMKITVPSREQVEARGDLGKEPGAGDWAADERGQENGVPENPWIELPKGVYQGDSGQPDSRQKINLNTATKEELMTLKGIGEAKAADIIRYREEEGPFQTIEEIMNISGIKEAAFRKIKDDITV